MASIPSQPNAINGELELPKAIERLEQISHGLRYLGQSLALISFVNFVAAVLAYGVAPKIFYNHESVVQLMLLGSCAATLSALVLAVRFETRRKIGDVLFKEASDDLQWHSRFSEAVITLPPELRPDIKARIALRSFAETTDLPLVPGRFGPLVYILLNVSSLALYGLELARHS
jgi:hypothetical protein